MSELCPEMRITSALMDVYPEPIRQPVIDLSIDLVNRRLGKTLGRDVIIDYLTRLQFGVERLRRPAESHGADMAGHKGCSHLSGPHRRDRPVLRIR